MERSPLPLLVAAFTFVVFLGSAQADVITYRQHVVWQLDPRASQQRYVGLL